MAAIVHQDTATLNSEGPVTKLQKAICGLGAAASGFMFIMPPGLRGYVIFHPDVPRSLTIAWHALALELGIVGAITAMALAVSSQYK
jgi:hypothetical protein